MISNACTRSVIGNGARGDAVRGVAQFALICGVSDDVIHVSITSGSPANSVPPHCGHASTGGGLSSGSTGSCSSVASTGSPQLTAEPHRERHAVEALPGDVPVVLEALDPMVEPHLHVRRGASRARRCAPSSSSVRSSTRTNHCGRIWNSTGRCVRSDDRHLLLDLLRTAQCAGRLEVGDDAACARRRRRAPRRRRRPR